MKKIFKKQIFLFALVLSLGFTFTQCSKETAVQKFLEAQVKALNAQCPVVIADGITLDNCEALPGKVFRYNYTLQNVDTVALSDTTKLKEIDKANILPSLKAMPEMKGFNDHGVTIIYRYHDATGKYLYQLEIAPEDYKK